MIHLRMHVCNSSIRTIVDHFYLKGVITDTVLYLSVSVTSGRVYRVVQSVFSLHFRVTSCIPKKGPLYLST